MYNAKLDSRIGSRGVFTTLSTSKIVTQNRSRLKAGDYICKTLDVLQGSEYASDDAYSLNDVF